MYYATRDPRIYTVPSDKPITKEVVEDVIRYNESQRNRYDVLQRYYLGEHDILTRYKSETLKNNRLVINHASYIVDTNVGYLLGNPVDYLSDYDISEVLECYKQQTINDLDNEIATNTAIYGTQNEYVYANEDAQPRSAVVDNRNSIVVYDTTLEHKKLFGVIYRPIYDGLNFQYYDVIYLDKEVMRHYKLGGGLIILDEKEHNFGDVPLIQYKNNPDLIGDFEKVFTLINAYNLLQSDRINDKEQLVDAILCMYDFDFTAEQHEMLKESRVLASIPKDGRVEYLTKVLHEADMDILRKNLEQDIHKISMCPNMSDENFSGNSSGVALRFKLLPFEQSTKNKERYFEKGLMNRFALYNTFLSRASRMPEIPIYEVDAVFKRNLPTNDLENSMMIKNLQGIVDNEMLISQLSFVKDASEVIQKTKNNEEEVKNIQEDKLNEY